MANEKFKVKFGLAVGDTSATIDAATGNTQTDGIGVFKQNTTGKVIIGDGSGNGSIEIGQQNRATSGTPFIDFHSSATNTDYDVRLLASGGNSTSGQGDLTITADEVRLSNSLTLLGSTSGTTTFTAAAAGSNQSYTLPTALPVSNGYVLASQTNGTMSWVNNPDTNTTYTQNASSTTGGANLNLVGSDSTTDSVKFANGTNVTVTATDANTISIAATDTNTTYTQNASSTTGGANLNLVGSDSTTDAVKFAGGTNVTVSATDANTITIAATDTNTTYTIDATNTTGGANINLVGSDSTTDSVKITGGPNVSVGVSATDTISITAVDTTYNIDASSTTGGANLNLAGIALIPTLDTVKFENGTNVTITATNANTISIAATDTNTTYTQNASSTTGGANLNLVGSDSTTDTIKFAGGTNITVTATDANTITIDAASGGGTFGNVTVGVDTDQTISTTSGNLVLQTATGAGAGTMTLTAGLNGNITVAPNGTGNIALNTNDGGNVVCSRNFVDGAIRNANTQARGNIWEGLATTPPTAPTTPVSGVSVDNSQDQTKSAGMLIRNYSTVGAGRGRFIFERSRGTAASPSAVLQGDFLGEVDVTGYSTAGWLNDLGVAVPAFYGFNATENWTGLSNCGTQLTISLQPTATALTTGTQVPCIISSPQTLSLRGDTFAIAQGKTTAFTATGCSTTGTTLTIGTLTSGTIAVGTQVQTALNSVPFGTYILANISGSGSGSTWTLSQPVINTTNQTVTGVTGFIGSPSAATTVDALQNLRLLRNTIQGSSGTTQVVTSAAGATLDLRGNNIQLEDAAGTDFVVLNANTAKFSVPVTTDITTTIINEGTTYTPAATVDNNISVQINQLAGGTTVIDLANLTGNGRGGSYNILVFNNTASGTPVQVKNTRINANNLNTHTIPSGGRIIINAYVVGDYATAQHLNVA